MKITDAVTYINELTRNKIPYVFAFNYSLTQAYVWKTDEIPHNVFVSFPSFSNTQKISKNKHIDFEITPVLFEDYENSFKIVQKHLHRGNSFLINLTAESKIQTKYSLLDIFCASNAPYKMCIENNFVVFSPEPFISISNSCIQTYPMKGTIDASVKNATEKILQNKKEMAEHATIVDLLRNDMSIVAQNVHVKQYRYTQTIKTNSAQLIQVSSCIEGTIKPTIHNLYGDILLAMMPAGSISGAPKLKTLQIIDEAETHSRDFYTGVMGHYNGNVLESAVMIRFIQEKESNFYYKSGGGITTQSNIDDEYKELIQKIYVPTY